MVSFPRIGLYSMLIKTRLKRGFPGIDAILRRHKVELAYIFGSTASGDRLKNSDVDLAVMLPRKLSSQARFKKRLGLIADLTDRYRKDFDVVVLNDIESPIFNFSIIASRGLVYCPDELVALNFESRVLALHDEAVFIRERD